MNEDLIEMSWMGLVIESVNLVTELWIKKQISKQQMNDTIEKLEKLDDLQLMEAIKKLREGSIDFEE